MNRSLDFKDGFALQFGHSDVVFDDFVETRLLHLMAFVSNLSILL